MGILYFVYSLVCYALFLGSFLYAIGFVGNFLVPKSMDTGPSTPFGMALLINLAVLAVFALQHSVMARKGFKDWWTKFVPRPIERSTYVLASSLALILLYWAWRPMGPVLWDFSGTGLAPVMWALCAIGWGTVLISTFLIDHFHLFGLRQTWEFMRGSEPTRIPFKTPGFYKMVRHPIYFGFTVAFWATPVMTLAHLVFAVMTLGYVLVGIYLEEKDLVTHYGNQYAEYKDRVSMLIPMPMKKNKS